MTFCASGHFKFSIENSSFLFRKCTITRRIKRQPTKPAAPAAYFKSVWMCNFCVVVISSFFVICVYMNIFFRTHFLFYSKFLVFLEKSWSLEKCILPLRFAECVCVFFFASSSFLEYFHNLTEIFLLLLKFEVSIPYTT